MKLPKILTKKARPKTVVAGEKKLTYFNNNHRDLDKYETIYKQGGLISQCIDAYPLFALANGYNLQGPPVKVKEIEQWLYDINVEQLIWQSMIDSLTYGDGISENVYGMGGKLLYVVPKNPKYFTINYDTYGIIESYTQTIDNKEITLEPEQITHLQLLSVSGETYGTSLIARSYDDIMRDTKTIESTAISIERHGYPRYHVKAGSEDNQYSDDAKRALAKEFEELKADNEFITDQDVEILPIDTGGVDKVNTYNELMMSRLLAAFGVPSSIIGTGENKTTMASATVEMKAFIIRVETYQKKVERCFNGLIDLKLKNPGIVTLEFNKIMETNNGRTDDSI